MQRTLSKPETSFLVGRGKNQRIDVLNHPKTESQNQITRKSIERMQDLPADKADDPEALHP